MASVKHCSNNKLPVLNRGASYHRLTCILAIKWLCEYTYASYNEALWRLTRGGNCEVITATFTLSHLGTIGECASRTSPRLEKYVIIHGVARICRLSQTITAGIPTYNDSHKRSQGTKLYHVKYCDINGASWYLCCNNLSLNDYNTLSEKGR